MKSARKEYVTKVTPKVTNVTVVFKNIVPYIIMQEVGLWIQLFQF